MSAPKPTANRQTYDDWVSARLVRVIDAPGPRARILERQYPRTTASCVVELQFRGFDAAEPLAERMAELIKVQRFGDTLAWHKSDIDHLAEFLEGANKLTIGSRHRVMDGISWEQDHNE